MTHLDLMHGHDRRSEDRCRGWLVQEKYNGIRALWTGSQLVTREGNVLPAPEWFIKGLPLTPLDCELYGGYAVGPAKVSAMAFRGEFDGLRLMVFDAPHAHGGYAERWNSIHILNAGWHVRLAPYWPLTTLAALRVELAELKSRGGEGFMLRCPHAPYKAGRSRKLLKFKTL